MAVMMMEAETAMGTTATIDASRDLSALRHGVKITDHDGDDDHDRRDPFQHGGDDGWRQPSSSRKKIPIDWDALCL
jgi:hypothetical protein